MILHRYNCRKVVAAPNFARIACSTNAGRWMFGDAPFRVVYNSIDVKRFIFDIQARKEIRQHYQIAADSIVIGSVGRLTPQKNHKAILSIFNEFHRTHPNSRLLLVGDGSLRGQIEQMARDLGIADSTVFAGAQIDPAPFYSAFDLFLVPSLWEGLSIATIEAQAAGLPIVAADTLPKEVNISENILYMSLNAPIVAWSSAIETELTGISERTAKGDKLIGSVFDLNTLSKTMQNIYYGLSPQ